MTTSTKPDSSLPYYGATREEIAALGHDPDSVEEGRLAIAENRQQHELQENAHLVVATEQAVASGELSPAEAAQALLGLGNRKAHDAYLEEWKARDRAMEAAQNLSFLANADAETYAAHVAEQREQELARVEQERNRVGDTLAKAKLEQLKGEFQEWVDRTPGAHALAPAVAARVDQLIVENDAGLDAIPATPEARERLIEQAIHDVNLRENITAGLEEKVAVDWNAYKKYGGSQSRYMKDTQGGLNPEQASRYEQEWKANRLQELAGSRSLDVDAARALPPSSEEISEAAREKYEQRQRKSTNFHQHVAAIEARGKDAKASRDRGENITAERDAYVAAVARAEAQALYGSAEVKSGYGSTAAQDAPVTDAPSKLDEYGGAFPNFQHA